MRPIIRGFAAQSRTKSKNRAETPCATQKCINTNIHLNTPPGGQKGGSGGPNSGNSFPYEADHPSIGVPILLLLKDGPRSADPSRSGPGPLPGRGGAGPRGPPGSGDELRAYGPPGGPMILRHRYLPITKVRIK